MTNVYCRWISQSNRKKRSEHYNLLSSLFELKTLFFLNLKLSHHWMTPSSSKLSEWKFPAQGRYNQTHNAILTHYWLLFVASNFILYWKLFTQWNPIDWRYSIYPNGQHFVNKWRPFPWLWINKFFNFGSKIYFCDILLKCSDVKPQVNSHNNDFGAYTFVIDVTWCWT